MTLHAIIQYLRYRWKANTRHGIHSPYVYTFIEKCLLPSPHINLGQQLEDYFGKSQVIYFSEDPHRWNEEFVGYESELREGKILVAPAPHKTIYHTQEWNKLKGTLSVLLTIDLYRCGLLISKERFHERQHFTLKYPLE